MEGNGFHMNPFVESVFGTKQGFHGMSHTVWPSGQPRHFESKLCSGVSKFNFEGPF